MVNANFDGGSTRLLFDYMVKNKTLKHLDISYNQFKQTEMVQLVKILSGDRKLVSLDLSLNQVWEGLDQKKDGKDTGLSRRGASQADHKDDEDPSLRGTAMKDDKEAAGEKEDAKKNEPADKNKENP